MANAQETLFDLATTTRMELANEAATNQLAAQIASVASLGDVYAISGGLGAGKTAFARAFIRALGSDEEEVPSPTFTLVQTYDLPTASVWHLDLYRLSTPDEVWELGIEEAFVEAVTLIEWPERMGSLLPANRLDIFLEAGVTVDSRWVTLKGHGRMAGRPKQAGIG
ncbi:MAG: tRNA (adenosine(37)-N6)-threonylcarbamoyltransferase complex ATPase subunit type 1 TsaE [Rhodospirillales bacterium]|jgi:tRNA threonylcarbamoyladenosine biosynthesis protein TsaE